MPADIAGKSTSRREQNKASKLDRIRRAARDVFSQNDFDQATMRDIAKKAEVGLGTLFSYAQDKRDLLFLTVNDDLEALAFAIIPNGDAQVPLPMEAHAAAFFQPFYLFFSERPALSRLVLRELAFYEAGAQASRFAASTQRMTSGLTGQIEIWQAQGRLGKAFPAADVAGVVFAIFALEIRHFLRDQRLDIAAAIARLQSRIRIVFVGCSPNA